MSFDDLLSEYKRVLVKILSGDPFDEMEIAAQLLGAYKPHKYFGYIKNENRRNKFVKNIIDDYNTLKR